MVKPVPVSAERAWNRAAWVDMPVSTSARVAILVISRETTATMKTVITASNGLAVVAR